MALTASADRGALAEGRPVTVTASFTNRNGFGTATDVGLSADPPYRTTSFNDAVFGQPGDGLVIEGGGADLWGGTNEFGTIHRVAAFGLSSVATPTPGGVADTQDIGVFMTAANDWTGTRGIAGFQDFSVT
ncbi:hypothetical protein [Streptomyces violaceusniger]|uniref:hypothetical protein n=1 Tax=Streptomyces violaceusniger TaxID=68280 RepID=UPI0031CDBCA8